MRRSLQLSLIVMAIVWIAGTDAGIAQRATPAVRFGAGGLPVAVPEPKDVFGFQPGADYKLASHAAARSTTSRKLDAASDRIVVERIGKSAEGRDMIVAIISSEANLKNRARYQEIARRLVARARHRASRRRGRSSKEGKVDRLDRRRPARHRSRGRAAHAGARLVAGVVGVGRSEADARQRDPAADAVDEPRRPRHRPRLVLQEPRHAVRDHVAAGHSITTMSATTTTATGRCSRRSRRRPSRGSSITSGIRRSSTTITRAGPFPSRIWGPPMKDPVNPNLDPLIVSDDQPDRRGDAQAVRRGREARLQHRTCTFDIWWNGSMRGGPDFHNMAGFLTETSLYRYATPNCYTPEEMPGHVRRAAQEPAGEDPQHQLHQSVARRLLAAAKARRVHADRVARDARPRRRRPKRISSTTSGAWARGRSRAARRRKAVRSRM